MGRKTQWNYDIHDEKYTMAREWVPRKNTRNTRKTQNEHFVGKCTFACLTLQIQCFFLQNVSKNSFFHKHELTMAGTTETEQHGTRTGTEKKHEKHKKDIERDTKAKNVLKGVPPP